MEWTGYDRSELVSGRKIQDLLSPGSRIFHETHLATLLPVCSWCRKIRSEGGGWQDLETYLQTVGTRVTHGICESCAKDYPE